MLVVFVCRFVIGCCGGVSRVVVCRCLVLLLSDCCYSLTAAGCLRFSLLHVVCCLLVVVCGCRLLSCVLFVDYVCLFLLAGVSVCFLCDL